jgi:phosphatidylglycerophosphate synthase
MGRKKNYKNFLDFSEDVLPKEKLLIDPFLSNFYRPFSLRISWLLYKTSVTPNFITLFQIIVSLTACLLISIFPQKNIFILGIILFHFSYLLDCSDGEIARAKNMTSLEGLFLDKFAHALIMPSIFMSVTIYYSKYFLDYQFFILLISFFSSLCTFHPVSRLVTSIVQKLITERENMQYDLNKYKKHPRFRKENNVFKLIEDKNFEISKKTRFLFGLEKKKNQFALQFFRHVSYLSFITFLLFLELCGIPIYVIFSFWLLLLLAVVAKELYCLYLVIFKNLIFEEYFLLLSISKLDFSEKTI